MIQNEKAILITGETMISTNTISINQDIDKVWSVLAGQFNQAATWMTGVYHSHAMDSNDENAGRVCILEDSADSPFHAQETLLERDNDNYRLHFRVVPVKNKGPKLPVIHNTVTVTLTSIDESTTKVNWHNDTKLTLLGKVLSPLLFFGLKRGFNGILADLKAYLETGQVSARKQRFDQQWQQKAQA